jgi:tRNA(Ile)-lysidine synthase
VFLLRCHPDQVQPPAARHWDGEAPLELGGLAGAVALHGEPRAAAGDGFTVRFRHGGERLLQHGQHVRLKTLFQDGGIVPWMRPHVPLLYRGDELLSVGGLWSAPSWAEIAGRELRWSPRERPR